MDQVEETFGELNEQVANLKTAQDYRFFAKAAADAFFQLEIADLAFDDDFSYRILRDGEDAFLKSLSPLVQVGEEAIEGLDERRACEFVVNQTSGWEDVIAPRGRVEI